MKYTKLFSDSSPIILGNSAKFISSSSSIKLDKLSNKYLVLPLNNMPSGFVSNILIVIVSGYFFLTSIFSKKLTFCSDSSISRLLIRKIFLSYILFNFSRI